MPAKIELLDTETGENIVRDGADAIEILRVSGGRYKLASDMPIKARVQAEQIPDGPPAGETPYVPPSQRKSLPPDPVTMSAKERKAAGLKKAQAVLAAKRLAAKAAKSTPQLEASAS